jgi:hypothetical protein
MKLMRAPPTGPDHYPENSSKRPQTDKSGFAVADHAYGNAVENRVAAPWHLFHMTGDILFTVEATKESEGIRQFQAVWRAKECISRRRKPRFSHVLMCVMPGLFIESTPSSWHVDDDSPAVRFIRAEECDWKGRSDFLVMRPRTLSSERDFCVKAQQRCIFHCDKPYHFYFVGDHEGRVFCSELVATIYDEVGVRLVRDRECQDTLPFDLELIVDNTDSWIDVTLQYARAEELLSLELIREEKPDLRDMLLRRYEASSEIALSLTQLGQAADKAVSDYQEQMTRPVELPPVWKDQTYVANISELFGLLQRDYRLYAQIRRFQFPGPPPERQRFNGIGSAELLGKLNKVEDARTQAAKATIGVIFNDFKSECGRSLAIAKSAKLTLAEEISSEERAKRIEKLAIHISELGTREPATERDKGIELIEDIALWISVTEAAEVSLDADKEVMKAFAVCGRKLHILALQVKLHFYGPEYFKLVRTIAETWGAAPEKSEGISAMRKSVLEDLEERCTMFERLSSMWSGKSHP